MHDDGRLDQALSGVDRMRAMHSTRLRPSVSRVGPLHSRAAGVSIPVAAFSLSNTREHEFGGDRGGEADARGGNKYNDGMFAAVSSRKA